MTKIRFLLMAVLLCARTAVTGDVVQAETAETQFKYARSRLEAAEKAAELRLVKELGRPDLSARPREKRAHTLRGLDKSA
jgi:hypothetical protein